MGKINQSLYSIDMKLSSIIDEIIDNGGEITEEQLKELEITQDNLKEKLDNYRKVIAEISSRIDYCKNEKTRIEALSKTRQRIIDRLKANMLDAVLKYGDKNKSGNKVIELADSKLMTRASKVCEVNTPLLLEFKDAVIDRLRELWDNDMLLEDSQDIDAESFIEILNANFNAEHDEEHKINFNLADLETTIVEFKFEISLLDLLKKINYDIVNTTFNHEDTTIIAIDTDKTRYKNAIARFGDILNCASICESQTLTIK